jgi:hypothetical protein
MAVGAMQGSHQGCHLWQGTGSADPSRLESSLLIESRQRRRSLEEFANGGHFCRALVNSYLLLKPCAKVLRQ